MALRRPPDEFERRRNDIIYDDYQFNRNPFVDRPEWVHSIFVDQQNDTRLTLAGDATVVGGATSLDIEFGPVLVGASAPMSQVVTLNETGNDGTYYSVATSGAATSSVTGSLNAFRPNRTSSQSITVGLNTSTSSPGQATGAVTIDNLDITTGGGSGRGANDGDDVVNLSLTVLDHATPSFSPGTELTSLEIDFGAVELGEVAQQTFALHNLASTPGFTSELEFTELLGAGDTSVLGSSLSTLVGQQAIAGGGSALVFAGMNTSVVGDYSATYVLTTADEDLPGRAFTDLFLTLTGSVVAPTLDGDFNGDGTVDAADFTVWRDGLGTIGYTLAEYDLWRANYGETLPGAASASASAPEPASIAWALAILALANRKRLRWTLVG